MLYSAWITRCRNQSGDLRRRRHIDWTGDGSSTIFQIPDDCYPVLDQSGTYVVKVATVSKTEGADYTLDKETGTLVMASAPTNGQAVTIDHSSVRVTDAGWLQITNDVILAMGDDFWKEFIDETLDTTANMLSISLTSAQPRCIAVYEVHYRESSSLNWKRVGGNTAKVNLRYDRDNNIVYISDRDVFPTAGYDLRIRGLKSYAIGTAVSDTLDVQDRFLTILENGCMDRYWQWRYKEVVQLISKMSTETTRTPLQELMMLSDRYHRLFLEDKARLKPMRPAYSIPTFHQGAGIP